MFYKFVQKRKKIVSDNYLCVLDYYSLFLQGIQDVFASNVSKRKRFRNNTETTRVYTYTLQSV